MPLDHLHNNHERASPPRPATVLQPQIDPICVTHRASPASPVAIQIGGSARGYQPGFALSALQETADVRVTDPYIYAPALAG